LANAGCERYRRRAEKKYDDNNSQDEKDNKSAEFGPDDPQNNSIDSLIGHVKDMKVK